MSELVQITTTTGSREEADRIATQLVERRLSACVQVVGPITSTYRWQGQVETSEEWMCFIKTSTAHLPAIEAALDELHSYDVPELVAVPIVGGSDAYLAWLREQLRKETGDG